MPEVEDFAVVNHERVRCGCGSWMLARYSITKRWSDVMITINTEPFEFVCPACKALVPYSGEDQVRGAAR